MRKVITYLAVAVLFAAPALQSTCLGICVPVMGECSPQPPPEKIAKPSCGSCPNAKTSCGKSESPAPEPQAGIVICSQTLVPKEKCTNPCGYKLVKVQFSAVVGDSGKTSPNTLALPATPIILSDIDSQDTYSPDDSVLNGIHPSIRTTVLLC